MRANAPLSRTIRFVTMVLAASQIQAACSYSPPPVVSHGQGAETLGPERMAVGAEAGIGTVASWWNANNLSDPDVNSGLVGAARLRFGATNNLDLGLVGGMGPDQTFVAGPELKWRFARLAPEPADRPDDASDSEAAPAFDAALIVGLGVGSTNQRYDDSDNQAGYDPDASHLFLAPYQGVIASGGVQVIQMFAALRLAESETLGNEASDLTLYPIFAFGTQVHPTRSLAFFAEIDVGGGITMEDTSDSAFILFPSAGFSVTLDNVWGK